MLCLEALDKFGKCFASCLLNVLEARNVKNSLTSFMCNFTNSGQFNSKQVGNCLLVPGGSQSPDRQI